jgi:hypothetical protein
MRLGQHLLLTALECLLAKPTWLCVDTVDVLYVYADAGFAMLVLALVVLQVQD